MEKQVKCDCGWEFRGTEDVLAAAVIQHGKDVHQMELTRDQALAQAKPV